MAGEMIARFASLRFQLAVISLLIAGTALYCVLNKDCTLLTADQQGFRLYQQGDYGQAATSFSDPQWQGIALFRQGEFEQAAGVFAGYDNASAAYNHGNALVMLGKYEAAIERYEYALALNPGWKAAETNREIAQARAEMLKKEGGDMTGGKMGADEIVFEQGKSPPGSGTEQVDADQPANDAEFRSIWLRQVQTRPADFLRAKFSYQYATRQDTDEQ